MDDYECRENANGRMIDHLNKSIDLNKGRIRTAKKRYIELNSEVTRMNEKEIKSNKDGDKDSTKKQRVVEKGGEEQVINYDILDSSSSEDEEHEDDGFDIDKQCNIELTFDCTSSSTSGSGSSTQVNVMDDDSVVGGKTTEE